MLSGKPLRPWKKSRRRGVSIWRIALLVLLMGGAAAYAFWRLRPVPPTWQPIGAERVVTPAFDIAEEGAREALRVLSARGFNEYLGGWLGTTCTADQSGEVYVFTDTGLVNGTGFESNPVRITVVFDANGSGEIVREDIEWAPPAPVVQAGDSSVVRRVPPAATHVVSTRQRRSLDPAAAERFRDLLLEAGYAGMSPTGRLCPDHHSVTLESCVGGRYYGVVRGCDDADPQTTRHLAETIDSFAREGATDWPIPVSTPTTPPPMADAVPIPGTD